MRWSCERKGVDGEGVYKNPAAITTATTKPALPIFKFPAPLFTVDIGRSEDAGVGAAMIPPVPVAALVYFEIVPTLTGGVKVEAAGVEVDEEEVEVEEEEEEEEVLVDDRDEVEVTVATTSETVMVFVIVWVEV
ncbi:hypothetical protein HYALB_00009118 [Hymenoscyphus albidus]|uniref:Uncharacterized protein n=1 Tax=Hymenoscyphus albidus TaxID=595503 RepID=A0A9N9LQG3_9HELO|nr:hypothetical protein HYALB_00009118 [Hymenoscyphus albidus]